MTSKHIIFLHLPKNGGTTLNQVLTRNFRGKKVFSTIFQGNKGNLDDFYNLNADEKSQLALIRGHFNYGIHEHLNHPAEYFTFLRNSDERLLSFYSYVKRRPENRLYKTVNDGNLSFIDFIHLNDHDGNNGQIRKLSGINGEEDKMLQASLSNIEKHFPVVGLQERFNESLLVLAHHYKWPLPYYIKQNVSKKKKNISEEEQKIIKENNQGDLKLYEFIEERLNAQINAIPFFGFKLFKLRVVNFLISNPIALRVFKTRKLLRIEG